MTIVAEPRAGDAGATEITEAANGYVRIALDKFLALPKGPPYYEFEEGILIPMPRPHARHQLIVAALIAVIWPHTMQRRLGRIWPEIEVVLPGRRRVYVPDLVYLTTAHLGRVQADGRLHGAPDLVAAILSPSTRMRDRSTKLQAYHQAGARWYWLIEPEDLTIEELEWTERGYLVAQTVAPGQLFTPAIFPDLALDLPTLIGEPVKVEAADE
ncbi:MAG: Uma2 family endonuclease [Caldilineaceae bacterium]|nr:Uma2 family endonuclease [Caldilineaceae bacterium]